MNIATYKAAISAWILAQADIPSQWRDAAGGWQGKAFARLHLHNPHAVGVDELAWTMDTGLPAGADLVPTVQGNRVITLSVLVRSRDQNYPAIGYLEKLRTSLQKPSVKSALRAAGLAFSTVEESVDLEGWYDDRTESVASLDVHFNAVENERDTAEAASNPESVEVKGTVGAVLVPDFVNGTFRAWAGGLPSSWLCSVEEEEAETSEPTDFISGGEGALVMQGVFHNFIRIAQTVALEVGREYVLEVGVTSISGADSTLYCIDAAAGQFDRQITSSGVVTITFTATATSVELHLETYADTRAVISGISLRDAAGTVFTDVI